MAKVTWSAPLVNYARCEIEFDVTSDMVESPFTFGESYAKWLAKVMKGYESGVDEIKRADKEVTREYEKSPEESASVDAESPALDRSADRSAGSVEEAKRMLEDALGPTTELDHKHKFEWVDVPNGGPSGMFCECGEEEKAALWQNKTVEKSEPWKNKGPVRKPAKIDW